MIAFLIEEELDEMISSINHKNKKEIEQIQKKFDEIKADQKISKKKFKNIHRMIMENRVLSLKDVQ